MRIHFSKFNPFTIALGYFFLSTLWILISDTLLFMLVPQEHWEIAQNIKGWFFVTVMTLFVWYFFSRHNKEVKSLGDLSFHSNRILMRSIAHHWRQPLTLITLSMENLKHDIEATGCEIDAMEHLENAIKESTYLSGVIQTFAEINDADDTAKESTFREVLHSVLDLSRPRLDRYGIAVSVRGDTPPLLLCRPEFTRMLLNFLDNAIESIAKKKETTSFQGRVVITLENRNGASHITLTDNGNGFDPDILTYLFIPYFSTKFPAKNIGISLYWNKWYIEEKLGGILDIQSSPEETIVAITLPNSRNGRRLRCRDTGV
jgi:signal transduction histidine kinase